jgi:quinol monooxygenase YgiN
MMKIVRVIYTTTAEYAATNMENIRAVTNEVRKLNHPGIKYSTYLMEDRKTFMHFDQFENEAAHQVLTDLKSFKKFAEELEASGLESEPKLELLSLVSSTENFFDNV